MDVGTEIRIHFSHENFTGEMILDRCEVDNDERPAFQECAKTTIDAQF